MAVRRPLVLISGRIEMLPAADTLPGIGGAAALPYAPGTVTVATGNGILQIKSLQLTGSERLTLEGTARLSLRN